MSDKKPNIYAFATSELSQDATLAYILSWATPEYRDQSPKLNQLGENLLRALVKASADARGEPDPLEGAPIEKLVVEVQKANIDVAAQINDCVFLVIEDKTNTCAHSGQIDRYTKAVGQWENPGGNPWNVMPVYVKTGNECRPKGDLSHGVFFREHLLAVLATVPATGNTIIEEFRQHLQNWQQNTESFRSMPCREWIQSWSATQGYYMELEEWLDELPGRRNSRNDPGWGYVANPAGGFLGFWWHWRRCEALQCTMFLQLHSASELKVRAIRSDDAQAEFGKKARTDSKTLYAALKAIKAAAEQERFRSLDVSKAGTFRGGLHGGGVASIRFKDTPDGYIATNDKGTIDLPETKQRLLLAMDLVDAASGHDGDTYA